MHGLATLEEKPRLQVKPELPELQYVALVQLLAAIEVFFTFF
jgi:hypothetical protein